MIDLEAILQPIPGENPAGEEQRYTGIYDEIKEARRADEILDQGDWQHELKTSDWDKVIKLSVEALTEKTKDLQIAAWLTEGLIKKQGFGGLHNGLQIINGFLTGFWDHVYPEIDEDDLDFRAAPLEFVNNNLWLPAKDISLTDENAAQAYSWLKFQESRQVGFEDTAKDPETRKELINEGKISGEMFDLAVAKSSKQFYIELEKKIADCKEEFDILDRTADEKFGRDAPRLSDIGTSISECAQVVANILKDKRVDDPDPEPEEIEQETSHQKEDSVSEEPVKQASSNTVAVPGSISQSPQAIPLFPINQLSDSGVMEEAIWIDAKKKLEDSGIKKALEQLMGASYSSPSIREQNRYRLLMAKLCLKAERPDLARPLIEELHALIEELSLDKWESPVWIGEVNDVLYQCLMAGEPGSDDEYKAAELLKKLCAIDITKAIKYRIQQ